MRHCLICRGPEDHPVHGQTKALPTAVIQVDGRRATLVRSLLYLFHNYDPGERRKAQRRVARFPRRPVRRK